MYYILNKEWRKKIFSKAKNRYIYNKNLIKKLKIPKSTFYHYEDGSDPIPGKFLKQIMRLSEESLDNNMIKSRLPDNWRQTKGERNCVKKKKEQGTFKEQLDKCHSASSKYMKLHHKTWKNVDPEGYYKSQYEKFKKIGNYKFETKNKELVRNSLELETANKLFDRGIKYEYEPYIKVNKKAYFPDFLIEKNIIIECTMWRGYDKAIKLKKKIMDLKSQYKVYILVPKALNNYYKILNNHPIFNLDEAVPLAQLGRASDC